MKKNIDSLSLYLLAIFMCLCSKTVQAQSVKQQIKQDDLNLSEMILPTDSSTFVKDAQWYHWCNSIIKGEDGLYHLFYSRFPKSKGFNSWLIFSEIAHAVSNNLTGPYIYKETVIRPRIGKWDALNAHNVRINKFNNKFYLYYISTNNKGLNETLTQSLLEEVGRTGFGHRLWMPIRNNQRCGVAVSNSVNGPWKRFDSPIAEPAGPICNVTVNPTVTEGPDKKYYMIVKGDKVNGNGQLIQAIGIADSPFGPFLLQNKPAFDDGYTEDAIAWYDVERNRFYAIFHVYGQNYLGLITSTDGINWIKAKNYIVCKKEIPLIDGTIMQIDRMERPSIYVENGELKMLSFAVMKGKESFIAFLRVKGNK